MEPLWGCTLDLEDAFFHVPIGWLFHCYLAFILDNRVFVFQYLPFCLALAPWAFNRIINPIKSHLHLHSIKAHSYLDDFCFLQTSPEGLQLVMDYVLNLLQRLGLSANLPKSNLTPSEEVEYLGVVFHLDTLTLSLPQSKVDRILTLARSTLHLHQCSRRYLESLTGFLNWASAFVPLGRLHLRPLVKWMNQHTSPVTRDHLVPLDGPFKSSLQIWLDRSALLPGALGPYVSASSITPADDGHIPVGLVRGPPTAPSGGHLASGVCGPLLPRAEGHSPVPSQLAPLLKGQSVMVMTDNTTAVSCILNHY